jgi:hypothetical protein
MLYGVGMKFDVRAFKNMEIALSEIWPRISAAELKNGRPVEKFGNLLPREIWANWLLCAALNSERQPDEQLVFTTNPESMIGDGVIYDQKGKGAWRFEHVYVRPQSPTEPTTIEALISSAAGDKQQKGYKAYASGKTLLVYVDAGGGRIWHPNKAAKAIPSNDFLDVWAVSFAGAVTYEWIYGVALLSAEGVDAPTFQVRINKQRPRWSVIRIQ